MKKHDEHCGYDHDVECNGMDDCTMTFVCDCCGEDAPYCFGGDGDELCDSCWSSQHGKVGKDD